LGHVLAGKAHLVVRKDLRFLQGIILRGMDVYQPVDLAGRLATSTADADVGRNLAVTLGTVDTRKSGRSMQSEFEVEQQQETRSSASMYDTNHEFSNLPSRLKDVLNDIMTCNVHAQSGNGFP
jgi:hypothetical protein